jgi:hypothetical protein
MYRLNSFCPRTINHMKFRRSYQKHFQTADIQEERARNFGLYINNANFYTKSNPELYVRNFHYCIKKAIYHRRAGTLLKKIDLGEEIGEKYYDEDLFEFISFYRILNYSDKAMYDKYDEFLETIVHK